MNNQLFTEILISWGSNNKRDLPWIDTKDVYKIWISEIILQQTRVAQGKNYYKTFLQNFPDIFSLESASEDEVLKAWEGLGYYSRARNLHFTAKQIVKDFEGHFPDNYTDILKLKGIGPYTAAAISSFAFEEARPVIDGNVLRLITRVLGIETQVELKETQIEIMEFLEKAIQKSVPSQFNQALMDFGSLICTPKNPNCNLCPFIHHCVASKNNLQNTLPLKNKKLVKKERHFHFLDIRDASEKVLILHKREDSDIWKKLYELPQFERTAKTFSEPKDIKRTLNNIESDTEIELIKVHKIDSYKQVLTHQIIYAHFYKVIVTSLPSKINHPHYLVESKKVSNFAFPKVIGDYFSSSHF